MKERIYVSGRSGKAHIARYRPTGYGVAGLCGKSWREGSYTVLDFQPREVCSVCAHKLRGLSNPPLPGSGSA